MRLDADKHFLGLKRLHEIIHSAGAKTFHDTLGVGAGSDENDRGATRRLV